MPQGFTLAEILVSLAIVAVLAALLFPVLATARARAVRTQCISSASQLSKAMLLYAADNSDLPARESRQEFSWIHQLSSYGCSKESCRCPAFAVSGESGPNGFNGWAANLCLTSFSLTSDPARTVMFTETTTGTKSSSVGTELLSPRLLPVPDSIQFADDMLQLGESFEMSSPFGSLRHQGASNYPLADGHVITIRPAQVRIPANRSCLHGPPRWTGPIAGVLFRIKDLEGSND
ncbi:MAG: type II secretion system protein [Fimbriimonas sp.]